MPVSVITDVITWIELIAQIGVSTVELGVLSYLVFANGWLDMIRLISFWCDKLIIKYVDKFYSYFDKILNGTVFSPAVVERVMNGVFLFVTLFVLFKLMMLFMKYIVNPELVSDEKMGASSLIRRVIIGMCLMLFLNSIFTLGYRLQSAILTDNVFGQILLTEGQLRSYEQNKNQMGRVLAFNVYQGFWNLDTTQVNDGNIKSKYKSAIEAKDPGVFGSINQKYGDDYAIDYFPILSTVVLFYVLYLIIKYCIDIVVRMFKLFVLQMLGPLAITDYMVNGNSNEMFKAWTKTTISAYLMLFMRVFCIWFVAFITILMNEKCTTVGADGICADSILYMPASGDPDYLLRALITLGLLAFLMDLPKMLSSVFGLDLEQDASVKGLLNKVGGIGKMVGLGAIAAGGAAIGGAVGGLKSGANALKQFGSNRALTNSKMNKLKNSGLDPNSKEYKDRAAAIKKQGSLQNRALIGAASGAIGGVATGIMGAALSKTSVGGTVSSGYQSGLNSSQNASKQYSDQMNQALATNKEKLDEFDKQDAKGMENERFSSQMSVANEMLEQQKAINMSLGLKANVDAGVESLSTNGSINGIDISNNLGDLDQISQIKINNKVNAVENTELVRDNSSTKNAISLDNSEKLSDVSTNSDLNVNNTINVNDATNVIRNNSNEKLNISSGTYDEKSQDIFTSEDISLNKDINVNLDTKLVEGSEKKDVRKANKTLSKKDDLENFIINDNNE